MTTVIVCEDGTRYGFEFDGCDAMRITKSGKVRFDPYEDVQASLTFPSPAVAIEQEATA